METLYNPWIKPRNYKAPTDIVADNKKRDREAVKKSSKLRAYIEAKKEECWDALDELNINR